MGAAHLIAFALSLAVSLYLLVRWPETLVEKRRAIIFITDERRRL
jgi:hypothetical protein